MFFIITAAANLVLQDTIERIHVGEEYGDIPRGIFVIRGENVVLLGEIVCCCLFETMMLLLLGRICFFYHHKDSTFSSPANLLLCYTA